MYSVFFFFFRNILPVTIAFNNDGCKSVETLASFSESLKFPEEEETRGNTLKRFNFNVLFKVAILKHLG